MKINTKSVLALLSGGILAVSAIATPAAHAAESQKGKQYKTGAAVLGVLGAYFAVKGKTVPAVVAGAGAYYAYKKSKDAKNDYSYNDNSRDRYPQHTSSNRNERDHNYDERDSNNDDLGYDSLITKTIDKSVQRDVITTEVAKTDNAKTVVLD